MKIKFLGTAAYEGIPALFCQCPTCLESKKLKGKNLRTRTQTLINNDLLIDFNADTVCHYQNYDLDFSHLKYCLITHSHSDHLYERDIEILANHFSHKDPSFFLKFYSGEAGYKIINWYIQNRNIASSASVELVKQYELININPYKIFPIEANHDKNSSPFIYLIQDEENKTFLYGHDSGILPEEQLIKLKQFAPLTLISFDCTGALEKNWKDHHMSLDVIIEQISRLKNLKIVDSKTKYVINHFSHNGHATHQQLEKACSKYDIIVAYDGLELTI